MVCVCLSVCLYMWAYICIHTVPVNLFICTCDLHDDTCHRKSEAESLCHDPCPRRN